MPYPVNPHTRLDEEGREIPDNTPIAIRVGRNRVTNFDEIRGFIRRELSDSAARSGRETFDEANDFDVEDDIFPASNHEYSEEQEAADRETLTEYVQSRQARSSKGSAKSGTKRVQPELEALDDDLPPGKPGDSSPT